MLKHSVLSLVWAARSVGSGRVTALAGRLSVLLIAGVPLWAPSAARADVTWRVSTGDWSLASNWGGTSPSSSDWAFINNGGTATVTTPAAVFLELYMGQGNGQSGTVLMTGGSLSAVNAEIVAAAGLGTFVQTGGINTIGGYFLDLAVVAVSRGSYSLAGTAQLSAPEEDVGHSGAGVFSQSGGTNTTPLLVLGNNGTATGTYTLNAGQLTANTEWIGSVGSGTLNQLGGANTTSSAMQVGTDRSGKGFYFLSAGQLTSPEEDIGAYNSVGVFTQSGGTNSAGSLTFGNWDSSSTTNGSATYNLNGGKLIVTSIGQGGGAAALNVNGGTLQAGSVFSTSLSITLGASDGGATLDTAGHALTLAGSLSGTGSMVKIGSGTLTLTASNRYSGTTAINQGELVVNGSIVSPVTVNGGGMLGGTGTLSSVTVNAGGQLSPGDAPGVMHLTGNLTLMPSAIMDYELGSPSDEVYMPNGLLALNSQQFSNFNFTTVSGFGPGSIALIDAGSFSGSLGSGTSGMIGTYPANIAMQGDNLVLNVVPEPSTFVLLGLGAIGLLGCARRRWIGTSRRTVVLYLRKRSPTRRSMIGVVALAVVVGGELRASTVNIVGGTLDTASPNPWTGKGNAFRVDASVSLQQEEFYLNFTGTKTISFYVFDSPVEFGTYSLDAVNTSDLVGAGAGWYSSGPLGVPLSAGHYYITAFSAPTPFTYYFNSADSQAVSFGADVHAYATGTDPLGTSISSTVNDTAIYYERLTTNAIPEPSTLGLLGVAAVGAILGQLAGAFRSLHRRRHHAW